MLVKSPVRLLKIHPISIDQRREVFQYGKEENMQWSTLSYVFPMGWGNKLVGHSKITRKYARCQQATPRYVFYYYYYY